MVIGVGLMAMTIEDRQDANKAPRLEEAGRIHSVASAMVVAYETAAVTEDIHKRKFRRLGAAMTTAGAALIVTRFCRLAGQWNSCYGYASYKVCR